MSGSAAYTKAGYESKTPRQDCYSLLQNPTIRELVEEKKIENSQIINDKLAFEEEATFDRLFEIRDLPLDKETYSAIIRACTELIDRKRGKPAQSLNLEGGLDNTMRIIVEGVDINKFPKPNGS
jgi:hypothetical protein